jgi:hypothetical protein
MNTHCAKCRRAIQVDAFYLCFLCAGNEHCDDSIKACAHIDLLSVGELATNSPEIPVEYRRWAEVVITAMKRHLEREAARTTAARQERAAEAMALDQERKAS